MSDPADQTNQLYEEWRVADAAARAAERSVMHGVLSAIDTQGEPPQVQAWDRARSLRNKAEAASRRLMVLSRRQGGRR